MEMSKNYASDRDVSWIPLPTCAACGAPMELVYDRVHGAVCGDRKVRTCACTDEEVRAAKSAKEARRMARWDELARAGMSWDASAKVLKEEGLDR